MNSAETIKERIQLIITDNGLTSSRFAETIGIQKSAVSHILSGRNKPGLDVLNKILTHYPEFSGDWLITGEGEPYKNRNIKKEVQKELFTDENSEAKSVVNDEKASINREEDPPPYGNLKKEQQKKHEAPADEPVRQVENEKKIEKIVVFFTDHTFREYRHE